MTFDEFMQCLLERQAALLSMPEELTMTEVFQVEQEKLESLLDYLTSFSVDEQELAREQIRLFADQLNEKLVQLQGRYESLRQNIDNTQLRLRGMKAYAKRRIV